MFHGKKVQLKVNKTFQVNRNGRSHNLHFTVMSGKHQQPLRSHQVCLGIGAIKWMDVDSIQPFEDSPKLDVTQATKTLCFDATDLQICRCFPRTRKITRPVPHRIGRDVNHIVHAPRRVPVALKDKLNHELREMVNDDIIASVSEST